MSSKMMDKKEERTISFSYGVQKHGRRTNLTDVDQSTRWEHKKFIARHGTTPPPQYSPATSPTSSLHATQQAQVQQEPSQERQR
jgi:hypothetical protein